MGGDDRSRQVYIGYLPNDARMEDVEDFFKGYGPIKSINLKPGYGFVDFESIRDAEDAVKDLDGKRMCGETVDIQHAKGPGHKKTRDRYSNSISSSRVIVRDTRRSRDRSPRRRSYRSSYRSRSRSRSPPRRYSPPRAKGHKLLVSNISTRCRSKNLSDAIREVTKIVCNFCEIHQPRDREGAVSFDTVDEADEVLRLMNGYELKGRKIELTKKKEKTDDNDHSPKRERSLSDKDDNVEKKLEEKEKEEEINEKMKNGDDKMEMGEKEEEEEEKNEKENEEKIKSNEKEKEETN